MIDNPDALGKTKNRRALTKKKKSEKRELMEERETSE